MSEQNGLAFPALLEVHWLPRPESPALTSAYCTSQVSLVQLGNRKSDCTSCRRLEDYRSGFRSRQVAPGTTPDLQV